MKARDIGRDVVSNAVPRAQTLDTKFEPLWTVDEVARYLRLKPETIRTMARRGDLQAIKVGKAWRFPESSIKHLTNEKTNP